MLDEGEINTSEKSLKLFFHPLLHTNIKYCHKLPIKSDLKKVFKVELKSKRIYTQDVYLNCVFVAVAPRQKQTKSRNLISIWTDLA